MPSGVPAFCVLQSWLDIGAEEIDAQTASQRPVPGLWEIVLDFREGVRIFRRDCGWQVL